MADDNYLLVKKALDVSSLRQSTISSNIANINTPGYKVNKVEFEEYLNKEVKQVALKKTHKDHYGQDGDLAVTVEKRKTTYLNENGNNVDVDIEMAELAANEIYYSTLIQILNSKYSKLNASINR